MTGLDTNVLVRFITRDHALQAESAMMLFRQAEERREKIRVSAIVLCELVWVLGGRAYGFDRHSIAAAIERLLEIPLFEVEGRHMVRRTLSDYRAGRGEFSDYLIGERNRAAGCSDTATFDVRLATSDLFSVIAAGGDVA
jgi:predicted nucleic-acid-binding protein